MQEVMTRATIEEMVAHRDRAIDLYRHAFGKITEADAAMRAAREATLPFDAPVYADDRVEEIARFRKGGARRESVGAFKREAAKHGCDETRA